VSVSAISAEDKGPSVAGRAGDLGQGRDPPSPAEPATSGKAGTLSLPGHGTIRRVPLSRISWLVTVVLCLLVALLLLLNGYLGYFAVLLAVGAAAAVNLV
jgi:hypothetical protein